MFSILNQIENYFFKFFSSLISALNDWDETLSWSQLHSNEIYTDKTPYDKNYLHALHAFDLGDFGATARHLEGVSIPSFSEV